MLGHRHYLWLTFWPSRLCGDYGVIGIQELKMWGPLSSCYRFLRP